MGSCAFLRIDGMVREDRDRKSPLNGFLRWTLVSRSEDEDKW